RRLGAPRGAARAPFRRRAVGAPRAQPALADGDLPARRARRRRCALLSRRHALGGSRRAWARATVGGLCIARRRRRGPRGRGGAGGWGVGEWPAGAEGRGPTVTVVAVSGLADDPDPVAAYVAASERAPAAALTIWPESALPGYLQESPASVRRIAAVARSRGW